MGAFDDPVSIAFRRKAAEGTNDHSDLPIRPCTQIGTRLPHFPIDHEKFHGRPALVMAIYKLNNPDKANRYRNDIMALELAGCTTHLESNRCYGDEVIYRTPDEIARARATHEGNFAMDTISRHGNHRKHFPHNHPGFGVIDPVLWPEIIAARADALLYNASRQQKNGRQDIPDCWTRHGLVLDIDRNEMADPETFAADVPDFYEPAQRKNLVRWYPAGLTHKNVNAIIDIILDQGPRGRMNAQRYDRLIHDRRAALGAELGHYYLSLKKGEAIPGNDRV